MCSGAFGVCIYAPGRVNGYDAATTPVQSNRPNPDRGETFVCEHDWIIHFIEDWLKVATEIGEMTASCYLALLLFVVYCDCLYYCVCVHMSKYFISEAAGFF